MPSWKQLQYITSISECCHCKLWRYQRWYRQFLWRSRSAKCDRLTNNDVITYGTYKDETVVFQLESDSQPPTLTPAPTPTPTLTQPNPTDGSPKPVQSLQPYSIPPHNSHTSKSQQIQEGLVQLSIPHLHQRTRTFALAYSDRYRVNFSKRSHIKEKESNLSLDTK